MVDVSWPLEAGVTAFKDAPERAYTVDRFRDWPKDHARESRFTMCLHTGTHIDAPAHFLEDGHSIEKTSLTQLAGRCCVLDLTQIEGDAITREALEQHEAVIEKGVIVLLKTANSALSTTAPFNPKFVFLHISGAEYLRERGIKAVGVDYLGIERDQPDHVTHKTLLGSQIPIVEGLRLGHVDCGRSYYFVCLPLAIQGLEAAPARAVLLPL